MAEEDLELVGLKEDWDWHPREEPLTSARAPTIHGEGRALVVGGTRGIGAAAAKLLKDRGWEVEATGRRDFDIGKPETWPAYFDGRRPYDLVMFCAGELKVQRWDSKTAEDYVRSYWVHALGPLQLLAHGKRSVPELFPWWCRIVFLSTTGAINSACLDLGYGSSKACVEKMVRALSEHEAWRTTMLRLDLVRTNMLEALPVESLHGREVMEPEEAAQLALEAAGVL